MATKDSSSGDSEVAAEPAAAVLQVFKSGVSDNISEPLHSKTVTKNQ